MDVMFEIERRLFEAQESNGQKPRPLQFDNWTDKQQWFAAATSINRVIARTC